MGAPYVYGMACTRTGIPYGYTHTGRPIRVWAKYMYGIVQHIGIGARKRVKHPNVKERMLPVLPPKMSSNNMTFWPKVSIFGLHLAKPKCWDLNEIWHACGQGNQSRFSTPSFSLFESISMPQ